MQPIVIVIDGFTGGGAQRVIESLIPEWIKQGFPVALVLLQDLPNELSTEQMVREGLTVYRVHAKRVFDIFGLARFLRIVIKMKPFQIQAHLFWGQLWAAFLRLRLRNAQILWVEHNSYLSRSRIDWFFFKLLAGLTTSLVSVSYEVADFLKAKIGKNSLVILNPVPLRFLNHEIVKNSPRFIFVGRLNEQKNPLLAVQGFEFAIQSGIIPSESQLTIAGTGPLFESLSSYCSTLVCRNQIHLLGFISEEELATELAESKTLISTSIHEGCPMVRPQALALGCTIVTTRTGGVKGVLTKSVNEESILDGVFFCDFNAESVGHLLGESLKKRYWEGSSIHSRISAGQRNLPESVSRQYLVLD